MENMGLVVIFPHQCGWLEITTFFPHATSTVEIQQTSTKCKGRQQLHIFFYY